MRVIKFVTFKAETNWQINSHQNVILHSTKVQSEMQGVLYACFYIIILI